jgi:superfamily II DNA/RNA helicase
MVNNIDLCGYANPTPIQAYTIPAVLQNRDVIATAQTGTFHFIISSMTLTNFNQARARLLLT